MSGRRAILAGCLALICGAGAAADDRANTIRIDFDRGGGTVWIRPSQTQQPWVQVADHTPVSLTVDPELRYDVRVRGEHYRVFFRWEGEKTGLWAGDLTSILGEQKLDVSRVVAACALVLGGVVAWAFFGARRNQRRLAALARSNEALLERNRRMAGWGGDPEQLGPYTVLERLGQGGQARVYKVRHEDGDLAAIKIPGEDAELARFENEWKILSRFRHPGIVRILDYQRQCEEHRAYLVMELISKGKTLAQRLNEEGFIPTVEALAIARSLLQVLVYTHEHGIIHRDLSPNNIFVLPKGAVKVVDFGISKNSDWDLTKTGGAFGTLEYAAPEQLRDCRLAAPQTDLYTVGVLLYEMLTGRVPLKNADPIRFIMDKLTGVKVPPHEVNPRICEPLSQLIMRLLAPEPQDRPASAAEVLELLEEAQKAQERASR